MSGAQVRQRVEALRDDLAAQVTSGGIAAWLQPPVEHLITVLRRLGHGLYHCADVPGLPRTDNDLEQVSRRVKSGERRITGHQRADAFVVRVGGFAVYASAASEVTEAELARQLATVPAAEWQRERTRLHATQARQRTMRRFRLHRTVYLADRETRWAPLSQPP